MKDPKPLPKAPPVKRPKPEPGVAAIRAAIADVKEAAGRIGIKTHASNALKVVSLIDYDLQRCILCKFRKLDKKMSAKLFRGHGPLSRLSDKIDMAYALGITTDRVHNELHKIRNIRNEFAHTKSTLHFDEEPITSMFENLDIHPDDIDPTEGKTRLNLFVGHVLAMDRFLERFLTVNGITDEIYGLWPSTFDY